MVFSTVFNSLQEPSRNVIFARHLNILGRRVVSCRIVSCRVVPRRGKQIINAENLTTPAEINVTNIRSVSCRVATRITNETLKTTAVDGKINRFFANRGNNQSVGRLSVVGRTTVPNYCWGKVLRPPSPCTPSMLILPVGVESVQNTILNPTITSALHGLGVQGGLNTFLQPTWMSHKFNIIEASPLSELSLDAFKFAACEF